MTHVELRKFVSLTVACGLLALAACTPTAATISATATPTRLSTTPSVTEVLSVLPSDLQWRDNPNVTGVQNATVVGDPTKSALYVAVGKLAQGTIFPAHTHPDARITTVIAGTMYYTVGEELDPATAKAYPAGSVIYTPPGVPHVMWAKDGEIVVQESGFGPSGSQPVSNGTTR